MSVLYLASQSPRRRQLLTQIGVAHDLLLPGPEEDVESLEAVRTGERADDYVLRVTLAKLAAARLRLRRRELPAGPILCADTAVVLGRRILGKPADEAHARAMLQALSGRSHRVLSAVALAVGRRSWSATSVSRVRFAVLSDDFIGDYVASGEPFGKAGAYAIQGRMATQIERIAGSYTGIMGLPLYETAELLKQARSRL